MSTLKSAGTGVLAVLLLLSGPELASAASCKASVRGPTVAAFSESSARWLAVSAWKRKVRKLYGGAYSSWDEARNARFFCFSGSLSSFASERCEAVGRPCKD